MQDRKVQYPNRYKIEWIQGSDNLAELIPSPGEITQEGTDFRKDNFLSDETAILLGGDPKTLVPDGAFRILANRASNNNSNFNNLGELEDITIEVGTLTNAGAGWNTYKFSNPMEAKPQVVLLQPMNFTGYAEVRDISAEGFLYCLRMIGQEGIQTTEDPVEVMWMATEFNGR